MTHEQLRHVGGWDALLSTALESLQPAEQLLERMAIDIEITGRLPCETEDERGVLALCVAVARIALSRRQTLSIHGIDTTPRPSRN